MAAKQIMQTLTIKILQNLLPIFSPPFREVSSDFPGGQINGTEGLYVKKSLFSRERFAPFYR
jgi:hypothetical protein